MIKIPTTLDYASHEIGHDVQGGPPSHSSWWVVPLDWWVGEVFPAVLSLLVICNTAVDMLIIIMVYNVLVGIYYFHINLFDVVCGV